MLNLSHLTREELELLFHECHKHLSTVSGSRNSFHPELQDYIHKHPGYNGPYRDPRVEAMHRNAALFLQRNPY